MLRTQKERREKIIRLSSPAAGICGLCFLLLGSLAARNQRRTWTAIAGRDSWRDTPTIAASMSGACQKETDFISWHR
jgi:hypothetical protein